MFGHDNTLLRFNSGNAFGITKDDGTVHFFGKLLTGKLSETDEFISAKFTDGTSFKGLGGGECDFEVTIAQVTNENVAMINSLKGELRAAFYQNGKNLKGTEMDVYIPELMITGTKEIVMQGSTLQTIVIKGSCSPQSANVSVAPSDVMPDDFATKAVTDVQTSNSPYYLLAEKEPA